MKKRIFMVVLCCGRAFAESGALEEVKIQVPRSQLDFSKELNDEKQKHSSFGVEISSFVPQGVVVHSYFEGTSEFKRKVPMISVERSGLLISAATLRLGTRVGVSYLQMTRSAPLDPAFTPERLQQDLYIAALLIGLELHSTALDWKVFSPFIQVNVRPMAGITSISLLGSASGVLGYAYDAKLGSAIALTGLDDILASRYFLTLSGGVARAAIRSSQRFQGIVEGGISASL